MNSILLVFNLVIKEFFFFNENVYSTVDFSPLVSYCDITIL